MSNPCIRCGMERIVFKKWTEIIELYGRESIVIHTNFVCPNPNCQKIVERQLSEQKEKREFIENQRLIQKQARSRAISLAKMKIAAKQ